MKKFSLFLLIVLLLSVAGCGKVEPAVPDSGLVKNPTTSVASGVVTSPDTSGDNEPMPEIYTENLLGLKDTATSSGVSYSIQDVQRTKEFGSRTLENLNDLSRGGTDEHGNLLGDEEYLFLTIQFTNTTDKTVEILRNQGGLCAVNAEGRVLNCSSEAVYCDKKWDGGTPGEVFHWTLAPGESVTSEIGWIISGWGGTAKALLEEGGDWSLYYEVEVSDDRAENYFIDLELDAA